jgi:GrpB-like predicted nucleotidyltransferase (UPF0157 family)
VRAHPDEALRYHELKERLAAQYGADPDAYWQGKRAFIESLLAKARAARGLSEPSSDGDGIPCESLPP